MSCVGWFKLGSLATPRAAQPLIERGSYVFSPLFIDIEDWTGLVTVLCNGWLSLSDFVLLPNSERPNASFSPSAALKHRRHFLNCDLNHSSGLCVKLQL